MESKLDHTKFVFCGADTLASQYLFKGMFADWMGNGRLIEPLNLFADEERQVNETAFREVLMQVASLPFDMGKMNGDEVKFINEITLYLSEPYEEDLKEGQEPVSDLFIPNEKE